MSHLGVFDVQMTAVAWFDPDMTDTAWVLGGEGSPVAGVLIAQAFALRIGF